MPSVVASYQEAIENIRKYAKAVAAEPRLAARIKQHPAWYAVRDSAGRWTFGPSKFVGYSDITAARYLGPYDRKDGRETEPALRKWFVPVDLNSALGRELKAQFDEFALQFGKDANANWRVAVSEEELPRRSVAAMGELDARIVFDKEICGGRPHIRGTRVRVSDIVTAIAEGETAEEILVDFPYLHADDISAALRFAARAVDHRVLFAA